MPARRSAADDYGSLAITVAFVVKSVCGALWRPLGLGYLAMCVAALGVGLFPRLVYVAPGGGGGAEMPALCVLAAGQVLFALLVRPIAAMRRTSAQGAYDKSLARATHAETPACRVPVAHGLRGVIELLGWMLATVPFYVAAGYVSDAAVADVLRVALYVIGVWTFALVAGSLLGASHDPDVPAAASRRGARGGWLVLLVLLAICLGGPPAWYIAAEFATPAAAEVVGRVAPVTQAWRLASFRGPWMPSPAWAALLWPAVAAATALARLALRPRCVDA
ncbi:MAG: hypothetical protein ACOC8F_02670 [Planctomycetota bacterium]